MRVWMRKGSLSGPKLRSEIDAHEAQVLRMLVASVLGLLSDRARDAPHDELADLTGLRIGNSEAPDDPVLARLLPQFHRPDPDAPVDRRVDLNGALRSLHEPEIIDAKRQAAQRLLETVPDGGGKFEINEEDAHAWAAAVNDVRLALGTMLDVGPNGPDRLPADHPMVGHLDVYHWLTVLQEYLVLGLMDQR
jgi:hypothetical protein